ncbi:MAG TPA: VPLPA-CTERM sorting domain-containing protein [Phycisphaerales bacterium]|nr:VPLPA-CTERM sorting domain-containing protein [Phycisphaerales bacterium]
MTDRNKALLLGCGAALAMATSAQAVIVNLLSSPSSGTINGALFETTNVRPTGTGFIDPFLRIQANNVEQGYNTSGRPVRFDEKTDGNFTHDLQLSSLASRTINGTAYYEFMIDINEAGGGQELISLERLMFFTNPTGSINPTDITQLGTLRYDMDAGDATNTVRYNDGNSGSGQGDIRFFIPVANFAGAGINDFVYMFARFGDTDNSDAGFEEFVAVRGTPPEIIPLPTAAGLAMAGLGGLAVRRRR